MARIRQRLPKRKLVHLEQDGCCLLCPYPLLLGCHLHHVIAFDDRGPDHPLNLVGLCPNHHTVLECVRRHIAPKEKHGEDAWLERAEAALKLIEPLPEAQRNLFDHLSKPHPLRREIRQGVEARFRVALAHDIARADAQVLLAVNKVRPRMLVIWRMRHKEMPKPRTEVEWQRAIAAAAQKMRHADFAEVIELHLLSLGLPFDRAWLETAPQRLA